jgi:Mn-containing catalase
MFYHVKQLMHPVDVTEPNPAFAQMLLQQFGGATGELTAALQYWVQSFHIENAGIRDMLQDVAIEEFSHLEMVGKLIEQHTAGTDQTDVYKSSLFQIRGIGPHYLDDQGSAWTAQYVDEGGNVVRDLRANIGAEAGARQTYEALLKIAPDDGTKKALHFLLTREISHTKMFMAALNDLGKLDDPLFGNVQPDETVDLYFNLSTNGDLKTGPWNEPPNFTLIKEPKPHGNYVETIENADDENSPHAKPIPLDPTSKASVTVVS